MSGRLKYEEELGKHPCCPPLDAREREATLYRFVHEEPCHPNNWRPPALIRPSRSVGCAGYALSFFTSAESARSHYQRNRDKRPNFPKIVGTQLATVPISDKHGRLTPGSGHVDLFEYRESTFEPTASVPL